MDFIKWKIQTLQIRKCIQVIKTWVINFPLKNFQKNITFNNNPHFLIDYLFIQINFLSTKKNKCANFMYNHDGVYIHGIIKELICDPK